MPEVHTFGITVQDENGREYQTWVTTDKSPYELVNAIRVRYDAGS